MSLLPFQVFPAGPSATLIFGGPEWPHIPGMAGNQMWNDTASQVHFLFGYSFIALIIGHVLAVILHKVKHKESLMARMSLCTRTSSCKGEDDDN